MEKVSPWCGQLSDRGWLKNRTEQHFFTDVDELNTFSIPLYRSALIYADRVA